MLIFRRWKVSLPLLLIAVGATLFVGLTAKPDYTMTAYVQFIPAKIAATDDPAAATLRNPWNQLGANTLGQASIYATQDQSFLDALKAAHHTDNFTLTMTYPNPIITIEVVGKTKADALDTSSLILSRLRGAAESLQRNTGVKDADIIATQRLDQGSNVKPSTSKVKRAVAAVAAAGLILTAGGTVGIDALLRRRARKRNELAGDADDGPPSPETGAAGNKGAFGVNGRESAVVGGGALNGTADGMPRNTLPDSIERTAIIIKRTSSVVKPPPPKQRRSPAATYRSANAQSAEGEDQPEEPTTTAPADEAADTPADSSDVRAESPSEWVSSENGNKPK
ncbi:hypothetical protein [Actinoplanes sp. NPDC051411]|uniref:hypothetical protein n=1 Tax=Actinoplanes sp. NPDC051411 TaxID=3155522 RepID=UPI00342A4D3E